MKNVIVIGSGNVASHIINFILANSQLNLVQIYARNYNSLKNVANENLITTDFSKIKEADVYIIAVSDNAIHEVSAQFPFKNRLVVHTSGSADLENIDAENRKGVFYPLQTFTKNKPVTFSEIPFCLETKLSSSP